MYKKAQISSQQIEAFIAQHRLPVTFRVLIDNYYIPLALWLLRKCVGNNMLFIGISGAQGTGKSTLAEFLRLAIETSAGLRVAVLSLDDFYLTKKERLRLGERIHPLLENRGVPGTHDLRMLSECIENLRSLDAGAEIRIPRFDKAQDDRVSMEEGSVIRGPVDAVILEGWCVGSAPQTDDELLMPLNSLEQEHDESGEWRRYVNARLAGEYATLFKSLDALVFLRAPNLDAVFRWRVEQEKKLAAADRGSGDSLMSKSQIAQFIQHYERITRQDLATLPGIADAVIDLDDGHAGVGIRYVESD